MLLWLPPYATGGEALDQEWWTETLAPWAEENNDESYHRDHPLGQLEEKYLTAFSSGQGPDVGYMYLEMYNDFIDMGALEPLDAYFTEEEISNYLYYDLGNVKGAQYTLPFIVGNARILYFNMDILNEAGRYRAAHHLAGSGGCVHSGEGSQSGGRYPLCTGMG